MIIAVCSDKGAPGVTTLATALGVVWPGSATVLEADPSGGDLTFRLRSAQTPAQDLLPTEPSVFTLAADVRTGLVGGNVARYGQVSTLGVRVIPGPLRAERSAGLSAMWPAVAQEVAASPDVVIADLGRMQPGHPGWPLAQAAVVVLVVARPDPEGLFHLRERAAELAHDLGGPERARNPVAVVMLAEARRRRTVLAQSTHVFDAAGLPIPVLGWMAEDRPGVVALRGGQMTRALRSSVLLRSVGELRTSLIRWWPQLTSTGDTSGPQPAGAPAEGGRVQVGRQSERGAGSRRLNSGPGTARGTAGGTGGRFPEAPS